MAPFDLIWWALAFLIASIPIGFGVLIVGYCIALAREEFLKVENDAEHS